MNGTEKLKEYFGKCFSHGIFWFIFILFWAMIFLVLLSCYYDIKLTEMPTAILSIICFNRKNAGTLFSASLCIWGFTLSCAIFLLGRLEEVYYGTSLKRIIVICFGNVWCMIYIISYLLIMPLIFFTWYQKYWLSFITLQIINYLVTALFALFITSISLRDVIISLIKKRTLKLMRKEIIYEEKLPILNMARTLNCNDMWQTEKMNEIISDMTACIIDNKSFGLLFNNIYLILEKSGFNNREERVRTINILRKIIRKVSDDYKKNSLDEICPVFIEIIAPVFTLYSSEKEEECLKCIMSETPWNMRHFLLLILLLYAEYLIECGVGNETIINELIEMFYTMKLKENIKVDTVIKEKLMDYWISWNKFFKQKELHIENFYKFCDDYEKIGSLMSETEICLQIQLKGILNDEYY